MDKKVSIIVPVYNVEKYIEECISSLVSQTYRSLEIILVDDASPDRCGEICDRWAEQDDRIRVIHKENGGAASARNAGIDAATGDYICFVDSDDIIKDNFVHTLITLAEQSNSDIAVCSLFYWTHSQMTAVNIEKEGLYCARDYLLEFTKSWTCSLMTNKLFKRCVIGSIRFEEGHYIDDEFFTYLVVLNSRNIAVQSIPLYCYRMRKTSVMQTLLSHQQKVMLDRIQYNVDRYRNVSAKMPELESAYFTHTLDTLTRYWHHSKDMPIAQKEIRKWVKQHTPGILDMHTTLRCKLGYLFRLYLRRPAVMAEPNPIQMDAEEYFD